MAAHDICKITDSKAPAARPGAQSRQVRNTHPASSDGTPRSAGKRPTVNVHPASKGTYDVPAPVPTLKRRATDAGKSTAAGKGHVPNNKDSGNGW